MTEDLATKLPENSEEKNNAEPWSSAMQRPYYHNYSWDEMIAGDTDLIFPQFLNEMLPNDGSVVQDILTRQMFLLHSHEISICAHNVQAMKLVFNFRVDLRPVMFCFVN